MLIFESTDCCKYYSKDSILIISLTSILMNWVSPNLYLFPIWSKWNSIFLLIEILVHQKLFLSYLETPSAHSKSTFKEQLLNNQCCRRLYDTLCCYVINSSIRNDIFWRIIKIIISKHVWWKSSCFSICGNLWNVLVVMKRLNIISLLYLSHNKAML